MTTEEEIRNWLLEMQACVRTIDYERAEKIFAPEVVGFGTYEGMAQGLKTLRAAQWQNIWPHIRNFTFRLNQLQSGTEAALAWVACTWDSLGQRPDGSTFARPGRMTVILARHDTKLVAVHTHFSLFPSQHD